MMTEWTASVAPTVAAAYDFSTIPTLVDVGGGHYLSSCFLSQEVLSMTVS